MTSDLHRVSIEFVLPAGAVSKRVDEAIATLYYSVVSSSAHGNEADYEWVERHKTA